MVVHDETFTPAPNPGPCLVHGLGPGLAVASEQGLAVNGRGRRGGVDQVRGNKILHHVLIHV